jgi:hypothetical protein
VQPLNSNQQTVSIEPADPNCVIWAHRGRLAAGSTDKAHEFLRGIQLVNRSPEVIGVDRLAANIADILDGHDYEVLPAYRVSEMSQVIAQIADHKYCRPHARPFRAALRIESKNTSALKNPHVI